LDEGGAWVECGLGSLRDLAALENKLHLAKQAQLNKFYLIKIKENKRN